MKYFRHLGLILGFAFIIVPGCKKEILNNSDCDNLRQGLLMNDIKLVSKALGGLLTSYSKENLNKLALAVSGSCNMTTVVVCFSCIYTNPGQSEIRFSFLQLGISVEKILDISYTPENKMRILNVHD